MTRPPRSLQGRLLALVLGTVAAAWFAVAAVTWFDVRHELDELLDGHLAQAAALLVAQQMQEVEDERHGIDAPKLHKYAPKVAFQVFHEGRLALRSTGAPAAPMFGPAGEFRAGFRTVTVDGVDWRVFAAHGAERDVQVYVGERVSSRAAILRAVLRGTLWPLAIALPLLALAVWWAVHRGMAPLRRLRRALDERRPEALHPVQVEDAAAEIRPMVDALNGLFRRIGGLVESERRFTADAAHELRTPIAAIRAQAQVAMAEADDERRRHALGATVEGCDRATRLVEQLLTLSRLEAGAEQAPTPVRLDELARRVVAEAAPGGLRKGQQIAVEASAPCEVQGDATLLGVLLRNLVDNAIRYSPPEATVQVSVVQEPGVVRLSVEDSGPGMANAELARLGERFFRVAGSGASGSGLGWSIVRRIADVHRVAVEARRSTRLGGLEVRLEWPAA